MLKDMANNHPIKYKGAEVCTPVTCHLFPVTFLLLTTFLLLPLQSVLAASLPDLIQAGDREEALELVRLGSNVNERQGDGSTALLWSVYQVDLELTQALLSREADPDSQNNYGASPLGEAVKLGHPALVKALLENGADVEAANADGQTALMLATRNGVVEVVELLLEYGADVNVVESWRGQTPLMWAAANNHPEVTRLLLDHGADYSVRAFAFDWGSQITSEPRAQYRPTGGLTALLYASRTGCTDCVKAILDAGADINKPTPEGITPLNIAIDNYRFDTAKLLLEEGANPHLWDWWGRTPLYVAIDMNSYRPRGGANGDDQETSALEIARMLLDAGVNVDAQLNFHRPGRGGNSGRFVDDPLTTGATPLIRAATMHDLEAVKLLLEYGADVNLPNTMGATPLLVAAGFGNARSILRGTYPPDQEQKVIPVLEVLLDAGADIHAKVTDTRSHNARIARMSTMTERQGQNVLFAATKQNWLGVVKYLLQQGADSSVVDVNGKTLLDAAIADNAGGRQDRPENEEVIAFVRDLLGEASD